MTTFPQTATLGHAAVYPARPIPSLHAIPRSLRKRNTGGATALHTIACSGEEFVAVCEFLAERRSRIIQRRAKRVGAKRAGKALHDNKA